MKRGTLAIVILGLAALAAATVAWPGGSDSVHAWPTTNISNDPNESKLPRVAVTPNGTIHVIWIDGTALKVMYSAKPAGGAWSIPEVVSTFTIVDTGWGTEYFRPAIAGTSDNAVHVLFCDDSTGDREIYYTRKPSGGSWSAPVNISNTPGTRSEWPDMTAAADGTIHAVFNDGAPTGQVVYGDIFYARRSTGGAWSSPTNISNRPAANDFLARIALAPNGSLHVVWNDPPLLWYATSPDGTSWSPPSNIASAGGSVWPIPSVAVDTGNTVHVAFVAQAAGLDIFHMWKPPAGSWSSPVNVSNTAGDSNHPDLRADPSGGLRLLWHDNTSGNYEVLYASKPSGSAWSAATNVSGNAGRSIWQNLAVASDGSLHAVWDDDTPGNREIFYDDTLGPAPTPVCGNSLVEPPEQCDPPQTNSTQCAQSSYCQGAYLCVRDAYGDCNGQCACSYDAGSCGCQVGQCGAQCTTSADCAFGWTCAGCVCVSGTPPPGGSVGGIAQLPDVASGSGSSAGTYAALAGGVAAALALTAGAWYARRRWGR